MTNRGCGLKSLLVGGLVLGLAVVGVQPAAAQSTIFNIPTTDTVSPKKGYFEFDYLAQLPKPDGVMANPATVPPGLASPATVLAAPKPVVSPELASVQ